VLTYPAAIALIGQPVSIAPSLVGAKGPVVYALISGSLPPGLHLDPATGIISGVPGGPPGSATFSVEARDVYTSSATTAFVIVAEVPPPSIPTLDGLALLLLAALLGTLAVSRLAPTRRRS
jgi:hypothetical protein